MRPVRGSSAWGVSLIESGDFRKSATHAPEGDVVVRVHLFGIAHAEALEGVNLRELVSAAKIPKPYATEIRKGMRLADHVTLK